MDFCLVKRAVSAVLLDGSDADDNPELYGAHGQVTFTPMIAKGSVASVDEPGNVRSVVPVPVTARISDGVILHRGREGVKLFAGGLGVNPPRMRWKASFSGMQAGEVAFKLRDILFDAIPGGEVDLTLEAPVAGLDEPIVRGPRGVSLEDLTVVGDELVVTARTDREVTVLRRIPLADVVRSTADAAAVSAADFAAQGVVVRLEDVRAAVAGLAEVAGGSASDAAGSADAAKSSASAASTNMETVLSAVSRAEQYRDTAGQKATEAGGSAASAAQSASNAAGSATAAGEQATNAASSAGTAGSAASTAAGSASTATGAANTASTKAADAAQSAKNAADSERRAGDIAATGVPDATTTAKGKVRLAGDLGGTADTPTVPKLADKADKATTDTALAGKSDNGHKHVKADITDLPAVTSTAAGNTLVQRTSAGQVTVPATPSATTDAGSKAYVDTQVSTLQAKVQARPALFSGTGTPPASIPGAVVGDWWLDTTTMQLYKITGV